MKSYAFAAAVAMVLSGAACEKPAPPAPPPASKADAEDCYRRQDYGCAALNYYGYLQKFPTETPTRAIYAITLTRSGQHAIALLHSFAPEVSADAVRTRGGPAQFDGVAQLWWDSFEDMAATDTEAARDAARMLLEDEKRFIDLARSPLWWGEEKVIIG